MVDPTTADDLCAWWRARHLRAWPIGWSVRQHAPRHWLRVYSLPGGRRYPASGDDWTELLARHREVALTTLGERSPCWVIVGTAPGDPAPALPDGLAWAQVARARLHPPGPADVDDEPVNAFFVARCVWDFELVAPLVRACAEGELSLLVANLEPGQIYAPYEGGADLFFHMFCEHDDAARRFGAWRSPRADGL